MQPEADGHLHHRGVFLKIAVLHQKSVGAEKMRFIDVVHVARGAEHNDPQGFQSGIGSDSLQYFEPIHARHFQIEENKIGKGELLAIGEPAVAFQVSDGRGPMGHDLERIRYLGA